MTSNSARYLFVPVYILFSVMVWYGLGYLSQQAQRSSETQGYEVIAQIYFVALGTPAYWVPLIVYSLLSGFRKEPRDSNIALALGALGAIGYISWLAYFTRHAWAS